MAPSNKRCGKGVEPSTSDIADELMKASREQVARQFLEACGKDKRKRELILELSETVLGYKIKVDGEVSDHDSEQEEECSDHDSEQEEDDTTATMMEEIDVYPYEEEANAEAKEQLFEEFKALLKPDLTSPSKFRRRTPVAPKQEAIAAFGRETAQRAVLAYYHISKAGQTYSDTWLAGDIRDCECGALEPRLLLMCLQEQKLASATPAMLGKICDDLQLDNMVKAAVKEWGVSGNFPKLASCKKIPFQFLTANRRQCQQCEIFLARAFVCADTLNYDVPHDDLAFKLMACLEILDENVITGAITTPSTPRSLQQSRSHHSKEKDTEDSTEKHAEDSKEKRAEDNKEKLTKDSKEKQTRDEGTTDKIGKQKEATKKTKPSGPKTGRGIDPKPQLEGGKKPRNSVLNEGEHGKRTDAPKSIGEPSSLVPAGTAEQNCAQDLGKLRDTSTGPCKRKRSDDSGDRRKESSGSTNQEKRESKRGKVYEQSNPVTYQEAVNVPAADQCAKQFTTTSFGKGALSVRAISALDVIYESPYLHDQSAEVGEEMFQTLKALLEPKDESGPAAEAVRLFGKTLATSMVTACSKIRRSGMVYGSGWKDGIIQGTSFGYIPGPMLLLCLQEQRLARSSGELPVIIRDLRVCDMVKEAIRVWKLQNRFPLFHLLSNISALGGKKKSVLRCVIFVARTFRCMVALRRESIGDSLMRKVQACLSIVHSCLEHKAKPSKQPFTMEIPSGVLHRKSKDSKTSGASALVPNAIGTFSNDSGAAEYSSQSHSDELVHDLFGKRKTGNPRKPMGNLPPSTSEKINNRASDEIVHDLFGKQQHSNKPRKRMGNTCPPSTNPPPSTSDRTNNRASDEIVHDLFGKQRQSHSPRKQMGNFCPPLINLSSSTSDKTNNSLPLDRSQRRVSVSAIAGTSIQSSQKSPDSQNVTRGQTEDATKATFTTPRGTLVQLPTLDNEELLGRPWFDSDPNEVILNSTEIELAWLAEESTFALRSEPDDIQWDFVWQYASPTLKIELRRNPGGNSCRLGMLVRSDDPLVKTRFEVVRKGIRKRLKQGTLRTIMQRIIPFLRQKTRG
eukprot:scaffold6539_cov120-Cylindrotheca_fusiformis.AAC.3